MHHYTRALALAGMALAGVTAHATEGGVSVYPNGTENYMSGALPPPGLYGLMYGNVYRASRLNDHNGDRLAIPGFKVEANVLAGRLVWVTPQKLFGGDLAFHTIVPLVNLKVKVPGTSETRTGIGDVTVGAGIGFDHSPNLHSTAIVDVIAPTGSYDKKRLANIGKNHWATDLAYAVSYVDPKGFNGDIKLGYIINARNKDTDYKSGDEFHFDYAAGWGLGNGWTVGLGGYYYQQVSSDKQGGVSVPNSKSSAFAIGPSIKYDSGEGWFATMKWEKEIEAKNHTQGNSVWVKAVFPL